MYEYEIKKHLFLKPNNLTKNIYIFVYLFVYFNHTQTLLSHGLHPHTCILTNLGKNRHKICSISVSNENTEKY